MATFNTNYQAIDLPVGTYTAAQLGDGLSASTVHELYCLVTGSITITALGGGQFVWPATSGQSMNVIVGQCIVTSGEFVGFKSQRVPGSQAHPYYQ